MSKIKFLATLVLASYIMHAQNLKVIDALEKEPLERAVVQVPADLLGPLITDDRGILDIRALKGEPQISISSLGYETLTLSYDEIKAMGFVVGLQPSTLALDQVVVAASRWSQSSRELPYYIQTLKTKDIIIQAPQTTADLLGSSGNVFIQKSQQGGGSPMIRGFATNRLMIAIDGIRMNNAIFRSGNLQQVISLDPLAIERSEVFFGPGSVIYGSDAIGGVMSFNSLSPELSTTAELNIFGNAYARYSSANSELSQHLDLNIGSEKWAWRASFSQNRYGDLRMGANGSDELLRPFSVSRIDSQDVIIQNPDPQLQLNTGFQQFHTLQKIRFRPSTYWDFEYSFMFSETSDYDRYDRLIRTRNNAPRNAEWYYGPQSWMMNKMEVNYRKSNALSDRATLRLARQDFGESRHDRDFGDPELRNRYEEVEAYSANLDLQKRISNKHKIFYGLEAVNNQVRSRANILNINSREIQAIGSRYPNSSWTSLATYLNHEWEWSTAFTSQFGLRYNHILLESDFGANREFYQLPFDRAEINTGNLTGSLGFVFRPAENWKWRLNFGTAFRAPNVDDIGKVFDSGNSSVVVPNPDLEAEYAYNGEFGIATVVAKQLKLDLSAYFTYLDQAMVRRPYQLNGLDSIIYDGSLSEVQAIQNSASAHVYGLQAGADWEFSKHWTWRARFNWQRGRAENLDGSIGPSRHAAPWFGLTRVVYEYEKLYLELNAQFSGAVAAEDLNFEEREKDHLYLKDANGELYSPSWYSLNFRASYTIKEQLLLTVGLENISDQRYRPYSSGLVATGRNFILGLKYSF